MFRDLLMSLGLLHIEISAKDGKRVEYIKGSIEDIENLIEKSKPMENITGKEIEKLAIKAYGNDFARGEGYIAGYKQRLWEEAALPVKILSEKEFNTIISTQLFNNIRSSQFKKGMYAGYLETVSKEYASIVNEGKDNAGINDAIEFADWINKNASINAVGSWGYFGNMFYTKTSKELYDIFKSESQPQQKEVDGYDDEMPPL